MTAVASRRSRGRNERLRRRNIIGRARNVTCGKMRYTSQAAADSAAALKAENYADRYPANLRVYYCGRCSGYHHSSQPRNG